jgi:type IV secretory pathway TraG/TraD family ATPase VirD4
MCVKDWLDSIERDPHTMETIVGQAQNWIYPRIGARKLRDFTATEADNFFKELGQVLSKRTLVMIKSTLPGRSAGRRSTTSSRGTLLN